MVQPTIPAEVTAAINQLSTNQTAIMQQMATISLSPPPSMAAPAFVFPAVKNVTIPQQHPFIVGGFNQGGGYAPGSNRHRKNRRGGHRGCMGRGPTPFVTHMANLGCEPGHQQPQLGGFPGQHFPVMCLPHSRDINVAKCHTQTFIKGTATRMFVSPVGLMCKTATHQLHAHFNE
jgi:hypothetical protein